MDRNPYEPSSAPLADVPEERPASRPWSVTIAVALLAANLVIALIRSAEQIQRTIALDIEHLPWYDVAVPLIFAAVFGGLYYLIFKGRNWARIIILAIIAANLGAEIYRLIASPPEGAVMARSTFATIMFGLKSAANLAAFYLLLVPGREWFRRH